jgi:hypothetical protein
VEVEVGSMELKGHQGATCRLNEDLTEEMQGVVLKRAQSAVVHRRQWAGDSHNICRRDTLRDIQVSVCNGLLSWMTHSWQLLEG